MTGARWLRPGSILAGVLLLAMGTLVAGCGGDDTEMEATATDRAFIDMMVPHHQGAVEMAQIAQQRGEHMEIKTLAGQIIQSQMEETNRMKGWRRDWFGSDQTPPMDAAMMQDIEMLRTVQPFDQAFLDMMIPHHQMAILEAQRVLQQNARPEIRTLAGQIIEDQQREIAQMQSWRAQWYPNAPLPPSHEGH